MWCGYSFFVLQNRHGTQETTEGTTAAPEGPGARGNPANPPPSGRPPGAGESGPKGRPDAQRVGQGRASQGSRRCLSRGGEGGNRTRNLLRFPLRVVRPYRPPGHGTLSVAVALKPASPPACKHGGDAGISVRAFRGEPFRPRALSRLLTPRDLASGSCTK